MLVIHRSRIALEDNFFFFFFFFQESSSERLLYASFLFLVNGKTKILFMQQNEGKLLNDDNYD